MNIKEDAEDCLQLVLKANIDATSSYLEYEKVYEKLEKKLLQWYMTGTNTRNHVNEKVLKDQYDRGYKQGEEDARTAYKLGIEGRLK